MLTMDIKRLDLLESVHQHIITDDRRSSRGIFMSRGFFGIYDAMGIRTKSPIQMCHGHKGQTC